jgi:hypothetical protein
LPIVDCPFLTLPIADCPFLVTHFACFLGVHLRAKRCKSFIRHELCNWATLQFSTVLHNSLQFSTIERVCVFFSRVFAFFVPVLSHSVTVWSSFDAKGANFAGCRYGRHRQGRPAGVVRADDLRYCRSRIWPTIFDCQKARQPRRLRPLNAAKPCCKSRSKRRPNIGEKLGLSATPGPAGTYEKCFCFGGMRQMFKGIPATCQSW